MDKIEERIVELIEKNREKIIAFGRDIYDHAELGYKEFRTAAKFAQVLRELPVQVNEGLAITGVKGYLKGQRQDISLALIGELDALRIPTHPHANPETNAAHSCGHNAQLTGVVGAALALSDPEVAAALAGEVIFFAVPSEEYGEIEFKNKLKAEGKIRYGGGKAELIRIGAFDDISLSIVHHSGAEGISIGSGSSNGFVSKVIRYIGREAHAAAAPEKGINALNAASLGLSALAFQRETFRDQDSVRIHPIVTKGGNLVNVVPNEVVIETLVRARNVKAIQDASNKTDRAFIAGAVALGAGIEITTMPGYLPRLPDAGHPLLIEAARQAAPQAQILAADPHSHKTSSTDVGDLEHVLPVLSFYTGGVAGELHTDKFEVVNEEEAYIVTAKIFALAAYKLLKDKAAGAKAVVEQYKPNYTKAQYLEFMESTIRYEERKIVDE
ncbi:MAG TPA: amidohydrolase [Desulfosporosinus sp.]|nr:amidohydrolase [Desulfosporosinus sp.]